MTSILIYLAARLKEPSTWAGLGTLVTAVGIALRPDLWQAIATVGMGVGGLLAVLIKDPGSV